MKIMVVAMLLWQMAVPGQAGTAGDDALHSAHSSLNASYREQLLALAAADQQARERVRGAFTPQQLQADQGAARDMAMRLVASQRENQAALSTLIDKFGFPDSALVGEDGAHAAFLVAQHSTDRAFRDGFLQKMQLAAQRGAYSSADLAMFVDRNLVMAGKPQRYGTQRKADGSLFELEAADQLHRRRAEAGLPDESASTGGL
ncbi:DUF6624 domain-containing protein [Xanthomonas axonopodis pv. poinsettiicola]|uniref:DUF6624 domain-containing protein n=1 Tax=Xanthomonas TaxID=338 RepID=UPI001E28C785|nr:DUF6624 domain-containing protein [Xanthomonas codiaei]MCC8537211.1 hypothetical protein [Xanthomonas codiaei]